MRTQHRLEEDTVSMDTFPKAGIGNFWHFVFFALLAVSNLFGKANSTLSLMPLPASLQVNAGRLPVNSQLTLSVQEYSDERLERAIDRTLWRLNARTNLTLSRIPKKSSAGTIVIRVDTPGQSIQGLTEDESYSLETSSQQATLDAHTVVGALRGLETLLQLLDADGDGFFFPVVHIEDRPRFAWRGLMIDVSRHWEPVETIKRTLDAMAVVKLNVFHWHLSDDQGFRVESRTFPLLHKLGSDGLYYTQRQIREIVAYARDRGIRVVPEFDMPGHAHSWFIGYPQFASAPGPYTFKYYLGGDSVPFDPTLERTYRFIDNFIGEMAGLFPDKYWHVGGDEVDGSPWDASPAIRAFKKRHGLKDNAALQLYFNQRLARIVHKHGKQMVGWDEILNPDLPKDTVVQYWRGSESLALAAKQGHNGILSAPYYLDKMFPTATYYAGDPLPTGSDLDTMQAAHVLGGEVCVWGELVSEENIESRIWPYAAAIAERLWSPREVTDAEVANAKDMYRRLDIVSFRLEEAGSRHLTNPAAMLRRAAGGDVPSVVRDYIGLVQPLRLGLRQNERRPTQLTPLTALGDIVVSDPPAARQFAAQVDALLRDKPPDAALREELIRELKEWQAMKPAIAALADRAPVFHDAEGAASDLAELGAAGEEAIGFLANGTSPSVEWTQRQTSLLERAAQPKGLLRVAVLDAVSQLIIAAESIRPLTGASQ
jgi:hexosaminidase